MIADPPACNAGFSHRLETSCWARHKAMRFLFSQRFMASLGTPGAGGWDG